MTDTASLMGKLKTLRLSNMAANLRGAMEEAQTRNHDFLTTLERLVDFEIEQRWQSAIKNRFRLSKLNEKPTIDQFDFKHHPSRQQQKNTILNLGNLEFISACVDVIMIGHPGTGKTYLAKCIAYAACNANKKVLFTTAIDMINHLIAAKADHSLLKQLHYYQTPDLLVIDELGYLSLGQEGSHLFFQVISHRHEQRSTMLTTNLPFADWGKVFDSTTVATAIADRLVANSEVLILEGESYRKIKKSKINHH